MAAKKKRAQKKGARARESSASSSSEPANAALPAEPAQPAAAAPATPAATPFEPAAPVEPMTEDAKAAAQRALDDLTAKARAAAPRAPLGVAAAADVEESLFDFGDLEELGEFVVWGAFELIPEAMGGGELTPKQERMLSKCWTKALVPYLNSQHAPLAVAGVLTVEVLFKRAAQYRARRAVAEIGGKPQDAKGSK